MSNLSRRKFILTAGAAAAGTAILHGCGGGQGTEQTATTPSPSTTTGGDTPEVTGAKLGFIALTDAAPLFIAKEKGIFDKYGMTEVEVIKQASWGTTRDNIVLGSQGFDYGDGRVVENSPEILKYWADSASYPYKSHDLWFLTEDIRWGYLPANTDTKALVEQVNREDLWKEAAKAIGVPEAEIPTSTSRGVETFFDGVKFDPENPQAYLDSLKIKEIKA